MVVFLLPLLLLSSELGFWAEAQPAGCLEPHKTLLQEYKEFHKANKYAPDARYLVQRCWGDSCQGLGDRVRGTMWMLRIAIAHRKVLLVDWTRPAALTNFMLPAEIDWTFDGLDANQFFQPNEISDNDFYPAVYEGYPEPLKKFQETKIFTMTTNTWFYVNTMSNVTHVDNAKLPELGSCYFHFLFKLNQTIIDRGEEHLRKLYGPTPVDYVAWHWRHFDADGHDEQPIKLTHLMSSLDAAGALGRKAGIDVKQTPILLITDFNVMRHFVLSGRMSGLVTPNITARHTDPVKLVGVDPAIAESIDTYRDIFVDLYLLSRARCMLTSNSGYSRAAVWLGGGGGDGPLIGCHQEMPLA